MSWRRPCLSVLAEQVFSEDLDGARLAHSGGAGCVQRRGAPRSLSHMSFRLGPDTLRGVKDQETETREPVSK